MKLKKVIGFLVFMFLIGLTFSAVSYADEKNTNVWEIKAPMSTARSSFQTVVLNGKIYAIGGYDGNAYTNTVEVYDQATNKWKFLSPMLVPRSNFQVGVIDNKIYTIGGYVGSNKSNIVEVYDPVINKWSQLAPMPIERASFQLEIIKGKIYVMGGYISDGYAASVEVYDPTTNKWKSLSSMATPRAFFQTKVINNKIYAIGGITNGSKPTASVEVYDPATNKWTQLSSMTIANQSFTSEVVNGKIYVMGGTTPNGCTASVEAYDPVTNTWSILCPMSNPRCSIQSTTIDDKIYVLSGRDNTQAVNTVEVYDPTTNKWSSLASISIARYCQVVTIDKIIYALGGSDGISKFYDVVESYSTIPEELSAPTSLAAGANTTQIKLTWDAVDGVTGYNIKRSETAGGPYTTISSASGSAVTFNDTKADYGKTYYYVVSAVKSDIESPNSNEASATLTKSSEITGNRAILVISFNNSKEKEYDLSADEIDKFITWYDSKSDGTGKSYFKMPKHSNVKPFINRYEYIKYDNIESFEIKDYNIE